MNKYKIRLQVYGNRNYPYNVFYSITIYQYPKLYCTMNLNTVDPQDIVSIDILQLIKENKQ